MPLLFSMEVGSLGPADKPSQVNSHAKRVNITHSTLNCLRGIDGLERGEVLPAEKTGLWKRSSLHSARRLPRIRLERIAEVTLVQRLSELGKRNCNPKARRGSIPSARLDNQSTINQIVAKKTKTPHIKGESA